MWGEVNVFVFCCCCCCLNNDGQEVYNVNTSSILSHHIETDKDMSWTKYTTYILQMVFSRHLQSIYNMPIGNICKLSATAV